MALNFPGNCKIIGANLTTSVALGAGSTPWTVMWQNFDTLWPTCIKPQIDLMVGNNVGCNTFRLLGNNWGVLNGTYTQSYYDQRQLIVASYLKSLGCYYYPNFGVDGADTYYPATAAQIGSSAASTLQTIWPLGNSIGYDFVQEAMGGNFTNTALLNMIAATKAIGICSTIPMTCSSSTGYGGYPLTSGAGQTWMNGIAANFDFIDLHIYESSPQPLNLLAYMRSTFAAKEIVFGEFGNPQSIATDTRTACLLANLNIATQPDPLVRGGLVWCVTDDHDTPATSTYGLHTSAFSPRREELGVIRSFTGGSLAKSLSGHR